MPGARFSSWAYLVEEWVRFWLSDTIEVANVNQLEVEEEAWVGCPVFTPQIHMWKITQLLVSPIVQAAETEMDNRKGIMQTVSNG